MSCSPFDLRDYFFQELTPPQQLQVEAHVKTCAACQEEMDRLRVTGTALFSLRDEEIPQRIGFVSDKIFEPSPLRRWFTDFWGSTARLGFAAAAMLSVAITFSAWQRTPAPAPVPGPAVTTTAGSTLTPEQIDRRIHDAVVKAVADVQSQYEQQSRTQLASLQNEVETTRKQLVLAAGELDRAQRRQDIYRANAMVVPPGPTGEPK